MAVNEADRKRRSRFRGIRRNGFQAARPMLVCQVTRDTAAGVVSHGGGDVEPWQWEGKLPRDCRVVLLVPRSAYLVRHLSLPLTDASETRQMIRFEAEATIPREFEMGEVGFRLLGHAEGDQRTARYEVYVSRRSVIDRAIARLEEAGLTAELIVPSAAAWALSLDDGASPCDLAVAAVGGAAYELACIDTEGQVHQRVVEVDADADAATRAGHVAQAMTPMLSSARTDEQGRCRIGWPHDLPAPDAGDHLVERRANAQPNDASLLTLAGPVVEREQQQLATADLLPERIREGRAERIALKSLAQATAFASLAVILIALAVEVAVARYQSRVSELREAIEAVQVEGETVGRQIDQLEAVASARVTGATLDHLLAGLYRATPDGVTYSHVDLDEENNLRLRGQAESIALPFLLPERLEENAAFAAVALRDTSQSQRGRGSVVEFHVEATYVPPHEGSER